MWKVIEKRLKEKNMTIYALSKRTGITRQNLYALRDNRKQSVSLNTGFKLADALEIDVNEFRKEETT